MNSHAKPLSKLQIYLSLTVFERQCLKFTAEGYSETEIAQRFKQTPQAVEAALQSAAIKLNAENRLHALCIALSSHSLHLLDDR